MLPRFWKKIIIVLSGKLLFPRICTCSYGAMVSYGVMGAFIWGCYLPWRIWWLKSFDGEKKHAIPYFLFIWFWKNTSTKTTAVIGITSCLEEKLQSLSPPIREAQSYPLSLYLPKCDCFAASHLVVCQLNSRLYKLNIGLRKKGMGSRKFSKGRVT